MDKLAELRRKLGAAVDDLDNLIDDAKAFDAKKAEIAELEGKIARAEEAQKRSAALARPIGATSAQPTERDLEQERRSVDEAGGALHYRRQFGAELNPHAPDAFARYLSVARRGLGYVAEPDKSFKTLGEQLIAIARSAEATKQGGQRDPRLRWTGADFTRAPSGAATLNPSDGGFLIQVDFATAIYMLAHDLGEILARVNKIPISGDSNGLKIPGVDETSRATGSRFGGVQSYWQSEGVTVAPSKPKFRLIEFDLKKLFSLWYATNEMLADATAFNAIAQTAFAEEITFMVEDGVFEGDGVGKPLGVINAPALVTVPKENGQASKTIVKENVDKMWSRCLARARKNAVWLINQDCEPQLQAMGGVVGTAGDLVYMPPGGLSGAPYATLKGKPVLTTEYSSTVGTPGDIALVDLSHYTVVDKGGVQAANSMHVAFNTDESVFRITYRADGKPMLQSPITPFKGSNTLSPFVALAAR